MGGATAVRQIVVTSDWQVACRSAARRAGGAPLSLGYAGVLVGGTALLRGPADTPTAARRLSTNLANLRAGHLETLATSACVVADGTGWPLVGYLTVTTAVFAASEWAVGSLRWAGGWLAGHVGGSVLVGLLLARDRLPGVRSRVVRGEVDVGPSYALAGCLAVAGLRLPRPLRRTWWGCLVVVTGLNVVLVGDFTAWGHLLAVACGVAVAPLLRHAAGPALPAR